MKKRLLGAAVGLLVYAVTALSIAAGYFAGYLFGDAALGAFAVFALALLVGGGAWMADEES